MVDPARARPRRSGRGPAGSAARRRRPTSSRRAAAGSSAGSRSHPSRPSSVRRPGAARTARRGGRRRGRRSARAGRRRRSAPPSIRTPAGIGYGPRSDSSAYSKRTALFGWLLPTTVIGIPIGPPSQRPEPKSACIVFVGPIAATVAADPAATGSASTRRFHGLSAGKTGHDFARRGAATPRRPSQPTAATTIAAASAILIVTLSAPARRRSTLESGRRRLADSGPARRRRTSRAGRRPPRSWISSTFSALRSPEREKLNEPTKSTSSATTTFACMKSCSELGRPRRRRLARERRRGEHRAQERDLPGADAVRRPLVEHLVDLGLVDHAGDVAAALVHDLDERGEDRAGGEHRRGDPDPLPRPAEELRDAMGERVAVLGREPRPHLDARLDA